MNGNKIRVAVADDCKEFREGLARCFENDERFELVGTAEDGLEICTLARDKWPDVITMDIMMPKMEGISAMKNILSDGMISRKPLVFVISNGNDIYQSEALESGATYYMRKPITPDMAAEKIHSLAPSFLQNRTGMVCEAVLRYGVMAQNQQQESLVTEELLSWNMPITRVGFRYLKDSICIVMNYPYVVDRTVVTGLYLTISQRYNVSTDSVERGMRILVEKYFPLADEEFLKEHYGKPVDPKKGRPTLSEFIAVLSEKLKIKQKKMLCKM